MEAAREVSTTIAAIASAPGAGHRGVIRVSGPRTAQLVRASFRPRAGVLELGPRGFQLGQLRDARGWQPALLLWMPGPRSFTREDVAELHLPGSPPLLHAALARLFELGAEAAQAGEFTRRAFLSGRIDLTQAEGVLEVVDATSRAELAAGRALLFGGLSERIAGLRDELEELRALCEASLDFDVSETGHVPEQMLLGRAAELLVRLREACAWEQRRQVPRGEPRIVLSGAPNAGKSRLFNRLAEGTAQRSYARALVSAHAGTTRDALRATWTLAGVRCRLSDTAGLDPEPSDHSRRAPHAEAIQLEAQAFARSESQAADLVLWVVDAAHSSQAELERQRAQLPSAVAQLLVWNKIDLSDAAPAPPGMAQIPWVAQVPWVAVSARSGAGLGELAQAAARELRFLPDAQAATPGDRPGLAGAGRELSARHREALRAGVENLGAGMAELRGGGPLELFAEALREASGQLDAISGRTTSEDVLDRIFARFCLGK